MEEHYARLLMTNKDKRTIVRQMRDAGMLEYGFVISGSQFRSIFDIILPVSGTKKDFDMVSLEEMIYSSFIRDMLLNEGKYFKSEKDNYRVLLPSENEAQVIAY